jgi:hypothetical protein
MRKVSVWLPEPTAEAVEDVADSFSLSKSGILRDLVGQSIEDSEELSEAVEDAIDDDRLRVARKQHKQERLRDLQEERERKASFRDRVRGYFRKRLEGDAAYHPDGMQELAAGYVEEARIWFDDEQRVEEIEQLVDQWLDWYDLGYWARQHSDRIDTEVNSEDVSGWFAVGEDLHRLRDDAEAVVETITSIADTQGVGFDSDAVVDAVSSQWSVCRGSVLLLIEQLTEEDSSISDMLRLGGDTIDLSGVAQQALNGSHSVESVSELPDDAVVTRGKGTAEIERDEQQEDDQVATDGGDP